MDWQCLHTKKDEIHISKLLIPWILLFAFISARSLVMLLYNFHIICIPLTVMTYRITNLNIILFKVYQLSIEVYKTLVHFEHRRENQCLALSEKQCFIMQESFAFVLRGRIWQVNLSSLFPKMSDTELLPALGSNVRSSAAQTWMAFVHSCLLFSRYWAKDLRSISLGPEVIHKSRCLELLNALHWPWVSDLMGWSCLLAL